MARPKGAYTRPQFRQVIDEIGLTPKIKKLLENTVNAAETNPDLAKWVLDHYFGRAPQPLENPLDDAGQPQPLLVKFISNEQDRTENSGDPAGVPEAI